MSRRDLSVAIAQLEDLLGSPDRVGGLGLDSFQEELDPGKRIARFADRLEAVVVVLPSLLQV